jgi:hypothetical protein
VWLIRNFTPAALAQAGQRARERLASPDSSLGGVGGAGQLRADVASAGSMRTASSAEITWRSQPSARICSAGACARRTPSAWCRSAGCPVCAGMILVTGGAGFIGSNFVLDWLAHGDEPSSTWTS